MTAEHYYYIVRNQHGAWVATFYGLCSAQLYLHRKGMQGTVEELTVEHVDITEEAR